MRKMSLLRVFSFLLMLAGIAAGSFAQTITLNNISDSTPCAGDTLMISCTASQVMNNGNTYQVELRDTAGNFLVIGTLPTVDDVVIITAVMPGQIDPNNIYAIRVISSDPVIVSGPEILTVEHNPVINISSNSPVLAGEDLMFTANSEPGSNYLWHHPDGIQMTTEQNPIVPNSQESDAGEYIVDVTGANGCKSSESLIAEVNVYTITMASVPSSFCAGTSASVHFELNRDFETNNVFTVQLSNINGSFENFIVIGETRSNISGSADVFFPSNLTGGAGFRMRIVASNPGITSLPSTEFHLRAVPQPYFHESRPLTFCEGESATITAYGGVQYEWNNGSHDSEIMVNHTGNYTLTMTDEFGCVGVATENVIVHSPNSAYIINVGSTKICQGESVRLVAYDGVSYAWSNGAHTQSITVEEAGNYNVTVTNSYGCSRSATSVNVTVVPLPDVTITPEGPVEVCTGSSVTLGVNQAYENYFWNTGSSSPEITVSEEGEYSAMVFDENGCSAMAQVDVVVHDAPGTPEVTYNSEIGELTCTPSQFYQWFKEGVAIDGAIYNHLLVRGENGLSEGTYTVEASNSYGCSKMSSTYELFEVVSGITQKEKEILSLYPNPNNGIFEVNIPQNPGKHIVITNTIGSVVYDAENNFEKTQLDLTHLKSGVYFLKAFDESGVSSVMFLKN